MIKTNSLKQDVSVIDAFRVLVIGSNFELRISDFLKENLVFVQALSNFTSVGLIQIEIGIAIEIEKNKMKKIDFDTDSDFEKPTRLNQSLLPETEKVTVIAQSRTAARGERFKEIAFSHRLSAKGLMAFVSAKIPP